MFKDLAFSAVSVTFLAVAASGALSGNVGLTVTHCGVAVMSAVAMRWYERLAA